jgi:hypothetical protein
MKNLKNMHLKIEFIGQEMQYIYRQIEKTEKIK